MRYLEPADLVGQIPAPILRAVTDRDVENACEAASRAVDGKLAPRYPTPLPFPYPPTITAAARALTLAALADQAGRQGEANPFAARAKSALADLDAVGAGKQPLAPGRPIPPDPEPAAPADAPPPDGPRHAA